MSAIRERRVFLGLVVAIIIFALGAGGTYAAGKFTREPGFWLKKMSDELQLTPAQRQQIALILKKHRSEIGDTVAGVSTAREGLRTAVNLQQFNEEAVKNAFTPLAESLQNAAMLKARIHSEIIVVLTPAQLDTLARLQERMASKISAMSGRFESAIDAWIAENAS